MKYCECPACGAGLSYEEGAVSVTCEYCDTVTRLSVNAGDMPADKVQLKKQARAALFGIGKKEKRLPGLAERDAREERLGKLRFTGDTTVFGKRTYTELEAELRGMGFRNINSVSMHDLDMNSAARNGKVITVDVDGAGFVNRAWYYPTATILIKYHGF